MAPSVTVSERFAAIVSNVMKNKLHILLKRLAWRYCAALVLVLITGWMISDARAEPIRVEGTRITLEPPEGFFPSEKFSGFQKLEWGATIVVYEMGQPFEQFKKGFTREALAERGMELFESGRHSVDGRSALLLRVAEESGGVDYEAWLLVFGDPWGSAMIVATYPKRYAMDLGFSMRQALMSARLDADYEVGTFEALPYRVDETPQLKIVNRLSGTLILTTGARRNENSIGDPLLAIGHAPGSVDFGNLERFSSEFLRKSEIITDLTDVQGTIKSVDGLPGYELTAHAIEPKTGMRLLVYQVILGDDQSFFWIQAFVDANDASEFLPEFQSVAESFRRFP